jgi:hypothetical protein
MMTILFSRPNKTLGAIFRTHANIKIIYNNFLFLKQEKQNQTLSSSEGDKEEPSKNKDTQKGKPIVHKFRS